MNNAKVCPICGATLAAESLDGPCARCLTQLASGGPDADTGVYENRGVPGQVELTVLLEPASSRALSEIAHSIGGMPRVLLRETDFETGRDPIPHPASTQMPEADRRPDKFQLFGEIARGGMGAVLRGRDVDLGRELAIKVLLESHKDNPDLVRRFVEEAQIGGQLQHPGVVPIYELGSFADRRPFFTMKLVKGRTLAELLRERKSPAQDLPRFLSIFESMAQTLAYAHARGVIHRDVKPSNIMVGSFGEVQVMDWGLAKVLPEAGAVAHGAEPRSEASAPISVIRTSRSDSGAEASIAGSVLGTPGYMAPEQARGEIDALDERADVFGLGAILCEILTGSPAFTGSSTGETLRKSSRGELGEAFSRLDNYGAEAELIGLTKDCLAPELGDRLGSAKAVSERITAYINGVQERLRRAELARVEAQARAEEDRKRAKVERDRRRLAVALGAAVLALSTVGGASSIYYYQQSAARAAAVAKVMGAARTLRDQAREQPEDLARWQVAVTAVEQADGALGGDGDAHRELSTLRAEVRREAEAAQRNRTLLDRLADIRSSRPEDNDNSATDAAYSLAFRDWGVDLDVLPPKEAVSLIRGRPPAVMLGVAAALDDWAMARRGRGRAADEWRRLVVIAQGVDPDPERDRLRAIFAGDDLHASLESLRALARKSDPGAWPVQSVDLLAKTLDHAGDPGAAAELLGRGRISHPDDVWINYDLGTMIHRARPTDTAEAIRAYSIARALRPKTAHDLGHLLERSGRTEEAIGVFEDLAHRASSSPRHLVCLGKVREGRGEVDAARQAFSRAAAVAKELIKDTPADPMTYLSLGNALSSLGDQSGAVAAYREGLRIYPTTPVLHDNLGIALGKKGDREKELAEHRAAIRLDPNYGNAHTNLSTTLLNGGDVQGALAEAKEAVRLEPDDPVHHTNLGAVLETKGDHALAVAAFREAVRLNPDLAEAHTNLGVALEGTGDLTSAVAEHRLAMNLKPSDPRPCNNLAVVLARLKDLDGAIAAAREAIRRDPKYGRGYRNLGVALEQKGDLVGAIEAYREAIRLRGDDAENHFNIGNALLTRGEVDAASSAYREAIRLKPDFASAHNGLGGALLEKKDFAGALAAYREAMRLAPGDADYRCNVGLALAAKGELDAAIAAFREVLKAQPKSVEAQRSLGRTLLQAGRAEEAIEAYRSLVRIPPQRADAHFDLAGALLVSGRAEEAIRSYREALRLQPEFPEALCNLGHALLTQGSYPEALEVFRRGHELGSKRPGWPYPSGEWVRAAERMNELAQRLPALERGEDVPLAFDEAAVLARMCYARERQVAAVRLWARAFAIDPKRAEDREHSFRYNAACSAALASVGRTKDSAPPDSAARGKLRAQALEWLNLELAAWSSVLKSGAPGARQAVKQTLEHWKKDTDLAGIRDDANLAELPEAERGGFKRLWKNVDDLLVRAGG